MKHDGAAERSNEHGDSGYSRIDSKRSLTSENQSDGFVDFIYDLVAPYCPANGRPSVALSVGSKCCGGISLRH